MKQSYDHLEQLLLHKRFDELTELEQSQVGLDEQAYAQQRRILLRSKAVLQKNTPPPIDHLAALQAHYQQHHPPKRLWQQSVPIYQVALLVLGVVVLLLWRWPEPVAVEKIIYVPQVDTVWQVEEKIVVQEKILYQTKIRKVVERDTVYLPMIDRDQFYKPKEKPTIFAAQPKSKSMKEMQGLLDFVGMEE